MATWTFPGDDEQLVQEFLETVTKLELTWLQTRQSRMPRIIDQTREEKDEYLLLGQRIAELKSRDAL
jgi:hypothetical protein